MHQHTLRQLQLEFGGRDAGLPQRSLHLLQHHTTLELAGRQVDGHHQVGVARIVPGTQLLRCSLEHPAAQAFDQATFFGQRNKNSRRYGAQLGVVPAAQGLPAKYPATGQLHKRLVLQSHHIRFDRAAQGGLHMQPVQRSFVHGGIGELVRSTPAAFGRVQSGVGQRKQHIKCVTVGREHGHANGQGDADWQATDHRALAHDFHQMARPVGGLRRAVHIRHQHHEFITAEAPHHGMRAGSPPQAQPHLAQHLVTCGMAQRVIQGLEVVNVHHHQRRLLPGQLAVAQRHRRPQGSLGAVG